MSNLTRLSAIDIGTNSAHLVVAEVSKDGGMRILDTDKVSLRLGQALDKRGYLSQEAIERTVATVAQMQEISRSHKAAIKAVATHATREAKNYKELIKAVHTKTGIRIQVIEGVEEARLVYLGMHHSLSLDSKVCLGLDIGGGSSEIIVATNNDIHFAASLKIGAVVLTERFLKKKLEVQRLRNYVRSRLAPLAIGSEAIPFEIAAASSGTVKTLAMIHAGKKNQKLTDPNAYRLPAADLEEIVEDLRQLNTPQAIHDALGVDEARADIILAGAIILDEISQFLKVSEWTISRYGLREGIVIDSFQTLSGKKTGSKDIRWRSVMQFAKRTGLKPKHSETMVRLSAELYDKLQPHLRPDTNESEQDRELLLLSAAAYLHECGKFISPPKFHRHSEYLITNTPLPGFTQADRQLIASITRFQRKSVPSTKKCPPLSPEELHQLRFLSGILRLAAALDRSRRDRVVAISCKYSEKKAALTITLEVEKGCPADLELLKAEMEREPLERCFDVDLKFESCTTKN